MFRTLSEEAWRRNGNVDAMMFLCIISADDLIRNCLYSNQKETACTVSKVNLRPSILFPTGVSFPLKTVQHSIHYCRQSHVKHDTTALSPSREYDNLLQSNLVALFLSARCLGCHLSGGAANFPYRSRRSSCNVGVSASDGLYFRCSTRTFPSSANPSKQWISALHME